MATKAGKFRFGLDVDNAMANSSGKAVDILNERRKFSPPLLRDEITLRPFHLSPGLAARGITQDEVSKTLDEVWRLHHRDILLMDEMLPEILRELRKHDISLEIITTMGARDRSIQPHLGEWLDLRQLKVDTVNFVASSEEKLRFPVHTIVDDEQQVAISLSAQGRPGLVYDAPWNREFERLHRINPQRNSLIIPVKDWSEVRDRVLELQKQLRT